MEIKIKRVKVTNRNNVVLQIPKWVVDEWGLNNNDYVDILLDVDKRIIITPVRRDIDA